MVSERGASGIIVVSADTVAAGTVVSGTTVVTAGTVVSVAAAVVCKAVDVTAGAVVVAFVSGGVQAVTAAPSISVNTSVSRMRFILIIFESSSNILYVVCLDSSGLYFTGRESLECTVRCCIRFRPQTIVTFESENWMRVK